MQPDKLIVFDSECILCSRFIRKILTRDQKGIFYFSTFQGLPSNMDKQAIEYQFKDSISYYRDGQWQQKSNAVLCIFRDLHSRLHWSQILWIVPKFLRDYFYDLVAKNRYKWFGKSNTCIVPTLAQQKQFIG